MAITKNINASTFSALTTFTQTVSTPSLTITNSSNNTFLGITLPTSVGGNNTSIGNANFAQLVSGTGNIGIGQQVFLALPSGTDNIAIGRQSGANAPASTTRCTFIGPQSGNVIFGGPFTDSTAIGSGSAVDASNQIMMGRSTETVVFPGNTTFNANLPTSTATPTLGNQLINKTFGDLNYLVQDTGITFTGTLLSPAPFFLDNVSLFYNNVLQPQMTRVNIKPSAIEPNITSINLGNTVLVDNMLNATLDNMTSFVGLNLKYMTGNFNVTSSLLTTMNFPELLSVGSSIAVSLSAITTISFPKLVWCNSAFNITAPAMTTLDIPMLQIISSSFTLSSANLLTSVNVSNLQYIENQITITAPVLTTLNFPALIRVNNSIALAGCANLTTFSFGSTLKKVGGAFTLNNAKLNVASVNNILQSLAALDGTNGTTAYSGFAVNIGGGTSAAPTGAGITAKTTLQGRGCTVTTN